MSMWINRAIKCCGRPIFFYSGLYSLLGLLFIAGSFYLDPDMGPVGLILLFVGIGIFLVFLVMAYRTFSSGRRTPDPGD